MQCCLMLCTLSVFDGGGEHFCKMQSWILEAGGWVCGWLGIRDQPVRRLGQWGWEAQEVQDLRESFEARSKK